MHIRCFPFQTVVIIPGLRGGVLFLLWFVGILTFSAPAFSAGDAEELLFSGRISEAWLLSKSEAQRAPNKAEVHELYVDLAVHLGRRSEVEAEYRLRVQRNPKDVVGYYLLGRVSTSADTSQVAYQKALEIDPDHARSHMGMGATYRNLGKLAEADAAYRAALSRDPTLAEAWIGLQTVLLSGGMREQALQAAELAISHVGHRAEVHLIKAQLVPDQAVSILEQGAKLAFKDPQIHVVLSQEYAMQGRGRDAVSAANRALAIHPANAAARRWRGFGWELQKGWLDTTGIGMIFEIQRELAKQSGVTPVQAQGMDEKYPKSAIVHLLLAQVYAEKGDKAASIKALERAKSLDPGNDDVYGALGLAYLNSGQPTRAIPLLKRAVEQRPSDASLALAYAEALWRSGTTDRAIQLLIDTQKGFPQDVRVVLTLAGWLNEASRTSEAYELLKTAGLQNPDIRVIIAVAAAARDLGREEEAAEILQRIARTTGSKKIAEIAEQMRRDSLK